VTPHADSALPEDPAALLAMIAALRGELAAAHAARRTAELGLQIKTLEAERLRVQIARLRHEQFGRSSERLAGVVAQLEMRLDVVLSDIAMPGAFDGAQLAVHLRRTHPGLRVVLMTGYISEVHRASDEGGFLLLPKPCSISALVAALDGGA
jgi:CheY-like chemotaxis protein